MGSFKIIDSQSKRFRKIVSRIQVFFNLQRDDFGVGGELRSNPFSSGLQGLTESRIIINVAV